MVAKRIIKKFSISKQKVIRRKNDKGKNGILK